MVSKPEAAPPMLPDSFAYKKRLHEGFGRGDFRKAALSVLSGLPNSAIGHNKGRNDSTYGVMLMPALLGAECTLRSSATAIRDLYEVLGLDSPCAETGYKHFRGRACQDITMHYAFATIGAVEEMIRVHGKDLKIAAQVSVDEFFWQVYAKNAIKDRAQGKGKEQMYRGIARDMTLNKDGQKRAKERKRLRQRGELAKALEEWQRAWNNFDDAKFYGVELELAHLTLSVVQEDGTWDDLTRLPLAILRPNPVDRSGRRIIEDLMPILDRVAASPYLHEVWAGGDSRFGYEPPVRVLEDWAQRHRTNFVVRHSLNLASVKELSLDELHERAAQRKKSFDGKPFYLLEELARIHAAEARPLADRPDCYAYTLDTLLVEGGPAYRRVTLIYDLRRGGTLEDVESGVGKAKVYALVTSRQGKIRQAYASAFWERYLGRWDVEEGIPAAKNYNHGRSQDWEWRLLMVGAKLYGDALARLYLACRQLKGECTTQSLWSARLLFQLFFDHWLVDQVLRLREVLVRAGAIRLEPPPDPGG